MRKRPCKKLSYLLFDKSKFRKFFETRIQHEREDVGVDVGPGSLRYEIFCGKNKNYLKCVYHLGKYDGLTLAYNVSMNHYAKRYGHKASMET